METDAVSNALKNTLVIAALGALITGCATTTPTAPPAVDLPAPTTTELHLERWWTNFNDPALTLLVDEALLQNLDLQAAIARIETARAQVKLAQSDLYPSPSLGANAARTRSTQVGTNPLPPGFSATGNDIRIALNASY